MSQIILTALPLPDDVRQVMCGEQGVLESMKPGSIWIDHSTTDYEQTLRLAKLVHDKGSMLLMPLYVITVGHRRLCSRVAGNWRHSTA
jgi:3-hydroxyisobutyrate dehydrogenase-like beta-hydroxyacid dehydrogenase